MEGLVDSKPRPEALQREVAGIGDAWGRSYGRDRWRQVVDLIESADTFK